MDLDLLKEAYAKFSNEELFRILENKANYTPIAIEVAEAEIINRNIAESELLSIKEKIETEQLELDNKKQELQRAKNNVKKTANSLLSYLNPIQNEILTVNKLINLVCIVLCFSLFYEGVKFFSLFPFIFEENQGIDFYFIFSCLLFLFLLLSLFKFWRHKQIGWILLSLFYSITCTIIAWNIIETFIESISGSKKEKFYFFQKSIAQILFQIVFAFGTLSILLKKDVREVYKISNQRAVLFLVMGVASGMFFYLFLV